MRPYLLSVSVSGTQTMFKRVFVRVFLQKSVQTPVCTENCNHFKHVGWEGGRRDSSGPTHSDKAGTWTAEYLPSLTPHLYESPTDQSHWEVEKAQEGIGALDGVSSSAPDRQRRVEPGRKEGGKDNQMSRSQRTEGCL